MSYLALYVLLGTCIALLGYVGYRLYLQHVLHRRRGVSHRLRRFPLFRRKHR